jgi:hypothetical protein
MSYEAEILDENPTRGYKIEWNNGDRRWVKRQKINDFYEYLRLVLVWRRKKACRVHDPLHCFLFSSDALLSPHSTVPKLAIPINPNPESSCTSKANAKSVSSTNSVNGMHDLPDSDNCCATCNGILPSNSWHKCHVCKRRIHGAVICPKGKLVYQDDDILYCLACTKSM